MTEPCPLGLTRTEWEMVLQHRKDARETLVYNTAIVDAINCLEHLADECGGGSGTDGEMYRIAARALERLMRT